MKVEDFIKILREIGSKKKLPCDLVEYRSTIENAGFNRRSPDFWTDLCSELVDEDVVLIFKGLVILEAEFKLTGGSVSGTIWIFRNLNERLPAEIVFDLVEWALRVNKFNDYCPLGSSRLNTIHRDQGLRILKKEGSYIENLMIEKSMSQFIRNKSKEEEDNLKKQDRLEKKLKEAQEHLIRSQQNRDARSKEIDNIKNNSQIDRLKILIESPFHISTFPEELFDIEEIVNVYSGVPDLDDLRSKIGNCKGFWKKLLKCLEAKRDLDL